MFQDPQPQADRSVRGARPRPVNIVVTTEPQKGKTLDEPSGTSAGTIDSEGPKQRPTEKDVRRQIFKEALARSAVPVSRERFGALWAELARVGVFELPRHRGGIPPLDKPSIRMTGDGRTWIFLRPSDVDQGTLPRERKDLERILNAWRSAKILIVSVAQ